MLDNQYDSILEVLQAASELNYRHQFIIEGSRLRCIETDEWFTPDQVIIEAFNRVEGTSNPEDSAVVYLLRTTGGLKGTLIDSYGMYANSDIAAFIRNIPIDRLETAGNFDNKACLNCGTILKGHYCYACGQKDEHLHEPFYLMVGHAVAHYWHFDGKFLTTLGPLLFKPGFLSNEFVAGRRVRYVHPIQMYLFLSIIFFILFGLSGTDQINATVGDAFILQPDSMQVMVDSLKENLSVDDSVAARIIDTLTQKFSPSIKISTQTDSNKNSFWETTGTNGEPDIEPIDFTETRLPRTLTEYEDSVSRLSKDQQPGTVQQAFDKLAIRLGSMDKEEMTKRFSENAIHNLPKLLFVLIPIFALILKLIFYRSKIYFVDHAVFTLHFHSFAFLLLLLLLISYMATGYTLPFGYLLLIMIIYLYIALKNFYRQNYFKAFRKLFSLFLLYFIVVIVSGAFYLMFALLMI